MTPLAPLRRKAGTSKYQCVPHDPLTRSLGADALDLGGTTAPATFQGGE